MGQKNGIKETIFSAALGSADPSEEIRTCLRISGQVRTVEG